MEVSSYRTFYLIHRESENGGESVGLAGFAGGGPRLGRPQAAADHQKVGEADPPQVRPGQQLYPGQYL